MAGFFKHPKWGSFNGGEIRNYSTVSLVQPDFIERLKTMEVKEGDSVRFAVRVTGNPLPKIQWFRNGKEIISSPDFEVLHDGDVHTLYIPEVFSEDSGKYTVKAENKAGNSQCTAELIVEAISDFSSPSLSRSSSVGFSSDRGLIGFFSGSSREATPQRTARSFVKPLNDQSVCQGSQVVLECVLPTFPMPETVEWFFNNVKIQPSTDYTVVFRYGTCSLTIAEAFPEDSGSYSCTATYRGEAPVSTTMKLNVEGAALRKSTTKHAPFFEVPLKNQQLRPGGSAFFECKVSGCPPPEIVWTRRGYPLWDKSRYHSTYNQESGTSTLKIMNLTNEDEGEYTCRAINSVGECSASAALLSPDHYHQWEFNVSPGKAIATSAPLPPPPPPLLPSGNSYRPPSRSSSDKDAEWNQVGEFKVSRFEKNLMREISYRESKFSEHDFEPEEPQDEYKSHMQNRTVPSFDEKPLKTQLREGFDAPMTCKVSGNPLPNIQWYHNGRLIRPSSKYEMQLTRDGLCLLCVHSAQRLDAGYYTCCATNVVGRDTCSAELYIEGEGAIDETSYVSAEALKKIVGQEQTRNYVDDDPGGVSEVYSPPLFLEQPSDRSVSEGETVRLDCRPSGRPIPDILWFRDGKQVFDDRRHKTVVNQDGVHSLIFSSIDAIDGGTYTCVARNRGGEAKFCLRLSVLPRPATSVPRFVGRMSNQTVQEGMLVTLSVEAIGFPIPALNWQKNGRTIKSDQQHYTIETDGGKSTLTIRSASQEDNTWFQCTAVNIAGTASNRARLNVLPAEVEKKPWSTAHGTKSHSLTYNSAPKLSVMEERRSSSIMPKEPTMSKADAFPTLSTRFKGSPKQSSLIKYLQEDESLNMSGSVDPTVKRSSLLLDDDSSAVETPTPPHFKTKPLPLVNVTENQSVHLECRLVPVGDPNMKVEWYKDGVILSQGHRFRQKFDFGVATLDILYAYPEDSGRYECRAVNRLGTDVAQTQLRCSGKDPIVFDSQLHPSAESILKLQELEKRKKYRLRLCVDPTALRSWIVH